MNQKNNDITTKEQEDNPTGVVKDSIDRSMVGQPQELFRGNLLTKIITLVVIIGLFIILAQCGL